MRLKVITTASLVAGLVLLLAGPWVFASPSEQATSRELAEYGLRGLFYFAVVCGLFLTAALGAVRLMKRQLQEFQDERDRNLEELVKGSIKDHEKR